MSAGKSKHCILAGFHLYLCSILSSMSSNATWVQACLSFFRWRTHNYLNWYPDPVAVWTQLDGSLYTSFLPEKGRKNLTWATTLRGTEAHKMCYVWTTTRRQQLFWERKKKMEIPQGTGKMGGRGRFSRSRPPPPSPVFKMIKPLDF